MGKGNLFRQLRLDQENKPSHRFEVDKKTVIKSLQEELQSEIKRMQAANEQASAGATDSESRAESKWDTQGLEASYLARGYATQFAAMVEQAQILKDFSPDAFHNKPIGIGALVECDFEGYRSWIFLLPCCGGTDLVIGGEEITVITPESALANVLFRKVKGDTYKLPNGASGKIIKVV
jgi:hypothetical protein